MSSIRERIEAREELLGAFLQMGSPLAADLAGRAGFDWALIDLEHGAGSESDLVPQFLGLAASGVAAFVRVESASRLRIGRALDLGATGIMVPQVNDADTARQLVAWCQYPPAGSRGVALSARGAGYGRSAHGDVGTLNREIVRIAQIETRSAVEAVDEIAAVDGIDVLFVGPSDLSHSLGVPGRFDDPSFERALRAIAQASTDHGHALGVHLPSVAEIDRYRDLGFTLISIAADSTGLASAFRSALSTAAMERAARPG
jgi:2-keto-3-deoxy-L-rhamnonate aldolase RhmA